jgi:NAD(P)-dependent dehydrogenase (short-subunit alcohol dehydrogenase family)
MGYTVQDKVVLITGANRGIGKAFVESFLSHGASKVYAAVRNVDSVNAAFPDAVACGKVVPLVVDLSQPETVFAASKVATDVDIVINNAGIISHTGPLDQNVVQRLGDEMTVNVYGLLHVAQAFAPILEQRGGKGILVQLNSVASMRCGVPTVSTYSASKAAAYSMTQALYQELSPKGVHVVSVHPPPVATDMIDSALPELKRVAEPASNIAEIVIDALTQRSEKNDQDDKPNPPFLIFPGELAKRMGMLYEKFSKKVIEERQIYG